MQATLNLVDHVLALGRRYQELGRHRDALGVFTRLCGFRELPAAAAEEAQLRLAELHLKGRRFAKARRHLTAALRFRPDSARYHFLMATAHQADDRGNLRRAAAHFRLALRSEPNNVRYLADLGLLLVRQGRTESGLARLQQAADLAPDDPDTLGKLVKGLRLAGRGEDARTALRAALFRNPRALRFRKLWADFQLESLRRQCRAQRLADPDNEDGPVVLPFVRAAGTNAPAEVHPTILRADDAAGRDDDRQTPGPDHQHVQ
jgi:tetratricopeptide (TPR) repeat protein